MFEIPSVNTTLPLFCFLYFFSEYGGYSVNSMCVITILNLKVDISYFNFKLQLKTQVKSWPKNESCTHLILKNIT